VREQLRSPSEKGYRLAIVCNGPIGQPEPGAVYFARRDPTPLNAVTTKVIKTVRAKTLWRMKCSAQKRDRNNAKILDLSAGDRLLLKPDEIRSVKVRWPKSKLID
jgi:hypothetical protein